MKRLLMVGKTKGINLKDKTQNNNSGLKLLDGKSNKIDYKK